MVGTLQKETGEFEVVSICNISNSDEKLRTEDGFAENWYMINQQQTN